ncbi:MAG: DUF89 family protein [Clostridiales bacterium]|nr:DUF89 family protein [Clostridiales bacterium]
MKSTNDCIYCYLKQAINCMEHGKIEQEKQKFVLYELMDLIKTFDVNQSPSYNSTISILKTYELINNDDPFFQEKVYSNIQAKKYLPLIHNALLESNDKLRTALHASSAGNMIDMGIFKNYDIEKILIDTLENDFSVDYYPLFSKKLIKAKKILILGDNCGEIIFDEPISKILSQMDKQVFYSVKSGPILNDALYNDAIEANIDKSATIIETGSNDLGVNLNNASDEFKKIFDESDLIIAKGQANFESLDEYEKGFEKIFFLLKIKCDKVADVIPGSSLGDAVFYTRMREN